MYIPSNSKGLSCGYGFVQMLDDKGKNKAIQMFNGYLLNDQALAVKIAWLSKAWLSNRTISSWDEFVELAGQYVDSGQLEAKEITYKLKVEELGTAARTAVLSGADDWIDRVKALVSGTVNLIIHYRIRPIEGWLDAHPNDALEALRILWERSDQLVTERIRVFSERLPQDALSGVGTRMNVISVFLMGLDAKKYPPFSTEWLKETYTRTGYDQPVTDADEAALYEHALNFFDQFIKEAAQRGLTLRHRLDAQSVAWAVHQERTSVGPIIEPPVEPTPDLNALAEDLLLSIEFLRGIETFLNEKRQVIFQGRPARARPTSLSP